MNRDFFIGTTSAQGSEYHAGILFLNGAGFRGRVKLVRSIKEHLISASWHNAERVAQRFKATFDMVTPNTKLIDEIELATHKRNHLVHRGGKDKEGNLVVITEQDLGELLSNAMAIGENIHLNLEIALDKQAAHIETEF